MSQKFKIIRPSAVTTFWSSAAQEGVCRQFCTYTKKLFGRKESDSFGRGKKPERALTTVPISSVLSPREQNGSFAITAAKTQWDQV